MKIQEVLDMLDDLAGESEKAAPLLARYADKIREAQDTITDWRIAARKLSTFAAAMELLDEARSSAEDRKALMDAYEASVDDARQEYRRDPLAGELVRGTKHIQESLTKEDVKWTTGGEG